MSDGPREPIIDTEYALNRTMADAVRHWGKRAQYLQAYGGQTVPPLTVPTRIDARCMAEGKHVGCNCGAAPSQPADYVILRSRARALVMLALQSERFHTDADFRDAVRAVLEVTHVYDAGSGL